MSRPADRDGPGCAVAVAVLMALCPLCSTLPALAGAVRERLPRPAPEEVIVSVEAEVWLLDPRPPLVTPTPFRDHCEGSIAKRGQATPLAEAVTDAAGEARLRVPPGTYQLTVRAARASRCARWLGDSPQAEDIVVKQGGPTVVPIRLEVRTDTPRPSASGDTGAHAPLPCATLPPPWRGSGIPDTPSRSETP